jgi:hypothetical protein
MVPESRLESTEHGLVPKGDGWFVLNAREASWRHAKGRSAVCDFEGEPDFSRELRAGVSHHYAPFTKPEPTRYREGWLPKA